MNFRLISIIFFGAFTILISYSEDLVKPNNTAATISDQTFLIAEHDNSEISAGNVSATDADNDPLTYSTSDGNLEDVFVFDSQMWRI